ncbi:EthD family reductase [Gordonia sp. NPDC003376]
MTIRVSVCYGQPADPAAFDEYYARVHIPLANAIPGLQEFTWGPVASLDGSTPPYYAVANLFFADADALKAGLQSAEMGAAAADVANFADGGATMFTQEEVSVRAG